MPAQPRPLNTCAHSGHWRGHLRLRGMPLRQEGQSAAFFALCSRHAAALAYERFWSSLCRARQ